MLEPQQGMSVQEIIEWGTYAERHGYGYIFRSDHLLPTNGNMDRDSVECWVTLGALAATTKRIKFGPMVTPMGFRNPGLLAQMACTLHSYSKGRLLLGVGAGWYKKEYLAMGYEFPNLHVRHEQLIEALKIIKPLLEGKRVNFRGNHYVANTTCYPYLRKRAHLILGGWSSLVRRAAIQYADEWNLFNGAPADFKQLKQRLSESGRGIEVSRAGPFFLAKTTAQLQRKLKTKSSLLKTWNLPADIDGLMKHNVLCGDVDEFVSQLNELRKAGVDRFYFDLFDPKDKEMVDLLTYTLKD
jgi:alkanesulfonate monooxygenase SsuD/methylene tetrahydromethanopterin reductase-like flavin-dependent oxidoreductase (luciferase family)